ncbi:hypothetical protein, partial [Heyndrickxia faecalis]|uniref:hypothetical protein n=1 Tax=Heyndrickxia faecalis TaxID=2824910 RepID=UPI003D233FD9
LASYSIKPNRWLEKMPDMGKKSPCLSVFSFSGVGRFLSFLSHIAADLAPQPSFSGAGRIAGV